MIAQQPQAQAPKLKSLRIRFWRVWAALCLRWARQHQDKAWADARFMHDDTCKYHIDTKYLWYARYDRAMSALKGLRA